MCGTVFDCIGCMNNGLLWELRTRTPDIGFELFIVRMGGVNVEGPPSGVTDSSTPVGHYSSSTNRAQYSRAPSSQSDSVKRVQHRQRSLAKADLEKNI